MREHLSRARLFLEMTRAAPEAVTAHRLSLAAIYSCRAVVELMLEAAEKQEIRDPGEPTLYWNRKDLENHVSPKLPYYALIERIRIHDFHRFGISPPNPKQQEVFIGGPVKLVAQRGASVLSVGSGGLVTLVSGGSQIKEQRPLLNQDGQFFDEESSSYVALNQVIEKFIVTAEEVVSEIEASAA